GETVVRQLLDDLPENGHLLLAGRRLPSVRRGRLLVEARATELSEEDLRLNDAEAAALAAVHGVGIDVIRGAGGWAALAELRARAGGTQIEQYVWEEALEPLPPRERDAFLLLVAVGGADADMVEEAVGGPVDRDLLRELPLVDSDDAGGLRPHAIWENLLRGRVDSEAATEARRRMAGALTAREDHSRAFELLAATGDWPAALAALFEACNDQRHPPWRDQMQRWRQLIPEARAGEAEVLYLEAMMERARDPWSPVVAALFARAYGAFQDRGDLLREAVARVRAVFIAWCRADRVTFDEMHERGRALVDMGLPIEDILLFNRAAVADLEGRAADIRDLVSRFGPLEPRLRHFPGLLLTFAALAEGSAESAVEAAEEAARDAAPVAPAAGTGWALLAPKLVAWCRGELAPVSSSPPADPGPRYSLAERIPTLALAAIAAAHVGDRDNASRVLEQIDALVPELGSRDLLAGFRAVAAAAVAAAEGDDDGARLALEDGLAGRDLAPAGAGRAVLWFPSLPYLFHEGARSLLDTVASGSSRSRVLEACRALLEARAGEPIRSPALLRDPGALLTALPAPLAVELLVRACGDGPSAAEVGTLATLAELAPVPVRAALRRSADSSQPFGRAARAVLAAVPIPPQSRTRIEVLGPTRLLRDGVVVDHPDWRRQRVRQLVCVLVALRQVRRSQLGVLLWPEFDEKGVSSNLRMTLTYVHSLLEPQRGRGDAPWFIQQSGGVLCLRPDEHLSVDAWEFEAALDAADEAAAAGATTSELEHLLSAVGLWRGEYLEDAAGEEWADPLRERVRQRFVHAAVRAGELLLASGRFHPAIDAADRALSADPWCETAMRLRVSGFLAAGERTSAMHAFEAARRALTDLGIPPEPATEELGRRLATGTR
ncbi:MAG TPA: BTAD domain-containing putative transcriptional regulator, partial [Acidimicrobiales bacterium]|nr:BTAD domain-containing putative transcriptional regulator [Acidimicrobiales bacterium]